MQLDELLQKTVERDATDLHISSGESPMIRVDGDLLRLDHPPLDNDSLTVLLSGIMNDLQRKRFEKSFEVDFSYTLSSLSRFRVNVFQQERGISAAFRTIPFTPPTFEELDMPDEVLRQVCRYPNGLVLVTGPTGTGKSTTLAAMIQYLNMCGSIRKHIITIEDPIEYLFTSHDCLIQQRESGKHTEGFDQALRSALREDPDILMVGEMRDIETIRLALTAAETGHLVFATLHTSNASKSVYRIVDAFPPGEKELVRAMLAESLRAVVSQALMKCPNGGRRAAQEVMICTPAIRNLIREDKIPQIYSMLQTGRDVGMRSMEQHVQELLVANKILPPENMTR